MEKALPLIVLDEKQKFILGQEACSIISKVKGKIAVVAIAGLYRTGKSYLLNRILGKQKAFEVGGTVNACTKGIYIWGKTIEVKNVDGTDLSVLLIDTEGLGSTEKDATYDAKVFSFAVLLSSYFVYNSMGVIDENALEKLSFIANLTKHIHVFSETTGTEKKEKKDKKDKKAPLTSLTPYFPSFLWLLRDFSLRLVDKENNPITPHEYLENALHTASKDPSKNEIREGILQVFTNRECMTLCRPVEDENDLQNLDSIEYDKLREKFRSGMSQVAEKILREVQPKFVYGKPINGQAFISLVKNYVDAINSGSVPTIQSAWKNVSQLECQYGLEAAIDHYMKAMTSQALPKSVEELNSIHEKTSEEALNIFKASALGESTEEYREKFQKQVEDNYKLFIRKNEDASESLCKEILSSLYNELDKKVQSKQFKTGHDLKEDWKRLRDTYLQKSIGPAIYRVLSAFLIERMPDSLVTVNEAQMQEQKNQYEEIKKDLRDQITRNNKQIDELQELAESRKKERDQLEQENQKLKSELQVVNAKLAALEEEKANALKILHEDGEDNILKLEKKKKSRCSLM